MSNDKSSLTIPANSGVVNQADAVTRLPGGAISMQFGNPEQSHDARFENESVRSGVEDGGSYRADAAGNVEKFGAITSYQVTAPAFDDDPFATAITPYGSPTSRITRDSLLTFSPGATPIPVKVAITLGWVREDGPGRFVTTGRHKAEIAGLMGQQ